MILNHLEGFRIEDRNKSALVIETVVRPDLLPRDDHSKEFSAECQHARVESLYIQALEVSV